MKFLSIVTLASFFGACERQASRGHAGTSPGVYDAGEGTCPATCSTPAGAPESFASDGDAWAALIGGWRICSDGWSLFERAPADTIGVEFAPPQTGRTDAAPSVGNLYFLIRGSSGPVRGAGFAYQQTYEFNAQGGLTCHPSYNSFYPVSAVYSPCPRQWRLDSAGNIAVLVPF